MHPVYATYLHFSTVLFCVERFPTLTVALPKVGVGVPVIQPAWLGVPVEVWIEVLGVGVKFASTSLQFHLRKKKRLKCCIT